jgi:putative transposase
MAIALEVSTCGYYAWLKRGPSKRDAENDELLIEIKEIHYGSNRVYGVTKVHKELNKKPEHKDAPINKKRVERLMRENNLRSKSHKKYKATTNSNHDLPVAQNLLNREFNAEQPKQKLVSDITYIPTDEGWHYLAGIMDLFGKKLIGAAMGANMTQELVCEALTDAIETVGRPTGECLAHSDRGSQYCSNKYQALLAKNGFTCSMSRKGNCWDNAPMESFWGKLKQEWLNEQHFKTRAEAESAVYDYIWTFYNGKRIHESNDYLTPDEYYYAQVA